MTTLAEDIAKLEKEAVEKRAESARLKQLAEAYPDIQKYVGRWNKVAYYSKSVNTQVSRFDIKFSCGCCEDSALEVWPYLETPHGHVYSDPCVFRVGEKHWIAGSTPYAGWKKMFQAANIPEGIIGAVQVHFDEGKKERLEAAERSNGDPGDEEQEEPDPLI